MGLKALHKLAADMRKRADEVESYDPEQADALRRFADRTDAQGEMILIGITDEQMERAA